MSVLIKMPMPQNCYECRFCETYLGHHICVAFLNYIEDPRSGRLDTCPLEEEKEPKHGKWETVDDWDGDCHYQCSLCGEEWFLNEGTPSDNNMNYCPNCGHPMEVEDEHTD